ncbi:MAG TPA: hypothetical protein VIK39_15395 [Candidatus Angelobacter sp.]
MIATIAVAALCCGCSTKRTVGIMSDKWEAGQHQDCIFKADQLYCIPPGVDAIGIRFASQNQRWKAVPRRTMLFSNSVEIIHVFERKRSEARNDRNADTGTYAAKFSERPTKYSIWDCFKTGVGSPGISCALSVKPSEKAMPFFTRKEEEAQMDDVLKAMNMDGLQAKCGKPTSETSDGISRSLIYTPDSGTPIAFRFATYGNAFLLDSAQSQEKKAPNDPLKIFWWKSAPSRGMREAGHLVKEMPCLKAERSQELAASAGRE